jgi:hypothetical protein
MDSFITVNCTVSQDIASRGTITFTFDRGTITFTFEDIPFVIYSHKLYEYGLVDHDLKADDELKVLNFHVNDDHTICSVYDLMRFARVGSFPQISEYEDSWTRTERIKRELANQDLKLTAPRDIFMKFIKVTASINKAELYRLYPEAYEQFSNGEGQASNPVSIIYEKKNRMFPSSGGRRKNGRHCRRTRQKTKRVKRAKLRKRSRKANHIKNVKH